MKYIVSIVLLLFALESQSQSAEAYFNKAANQYIDTSKEAALSTLDEAIKKHPNDENLRELKRRLEEEQNEEEQQNQQNQENQENQEEKKDSENQENSEQENNEQQEQENEEGEEQENEEEKSQEQMTKEKLEEMGISEEKARQLLEAMRQSEIKYLQQQRRKPTKRPPSGKPDW